MGCHQLKYSKKDFIKINPTLVHNCLKEILCNAHGSIDHE